MHVVVEQGGSATPLIISLISAAIAGAAFALTLRRELRDRPNVYVTADPMGGDGQGRVCITVENRGRQPATVGHVGLAWDIEPPLPDTNPKGEILANEPWSRVRLEPGGHTQIWWEPDRAPVHVDTPMRGYAVVGGRRIYEERLAAQLRWLVVIGWKPPRPIAAKRMTHPPIAPYARPVVSRWKLWKPKELRTRQRAPVVPITRERVAERVAELQRQADQD